MRPPVRQRMQAKGRSMARSNRRAPLTLLLHWGRPHCQPGNGSLALRAVVGLLALIGIALMLLGPLPASAQADGPQAGPDVPDRPTATAIYEGMVDLEWNDVLGAASYDVQAFYSDWFDLPGDGIEIAFYGPGAIIRGLVPESRYYFRVRASNSLGSSDWSEHPLVNPTGGDFGNWDDVPEPTNSTATGAPTISGTPRVAHTLMADISGIADENGLDRVKFHYQWISSDGTDEGDIEGATDDTYVLVADDEGRFIKVRVSFTDRGGYEESVTSAATTEVEPPLVPGPPLNLEVSDDENGELALSWDAPASDGGPAVTGYKVRWKSGNEEYDPSREASVSGLSYTVWDLTNGVEYTVQVMAVSNVGEGEGSEVTATPRDTAPPVLLDAQATGFTIILTYDEALDANSALATMTFRVLVDGTAHKVRGVSVFGSIVSLSLRYEVTWDDNVALSYSAPQDAGEQRVQDTAGNDAPSFSGEPVAKVTPGLARCSGGGSDPMPTAVEVGAVPIVVESTTDEYFVLFVRPDLGSGREIPVSVTLGQDGTTTLAENVAPLSSGHYRVEKYSIADPADVDWDCIDDVTELMTPDSLNPVNPAAPIGLSDGAVAIPDRKTFEALSYQGKNVLVDKHLTDLEFVKFYILGMDTNRPAVYFMNTETYRSHWNFSNSIMLFHNPLFKLWVMVGEIVYHPNVVAPDGSLGVYRYEFQPRDAYSFDIVAHSYELLAASMPLLDNDLAYYPMPAGALPLYHEERALFDDSRINVLFEEDIMPDVDFVPLNMEEGYGFLRIMSLEERPNPRNIVIYETLPNELPRVAGIITTVPQTPLSHVNLRAVQDGVPNAFIRDALDDADVDDLIGGYVHYTVAEDGWTLRAATPAEVDAYYAASRPSRTQTPERDLSVTTITPLSDIAFDDWTAFGVKAANVAVLRTLGFPDGTVPDGFAVPFYFYDEFMKHNGFYDDVEEMLDDPEFQSDFDTQDEELKRLRKKIKKGETPEWMAEALTEMHAAFPEGTSLRYRSSTNNEDLPGFSGAGLYDSKTQHPEETEEDGIAKSLKQVYASLWNFRAFAEREFHRIDQLAAAMGVLVHPNYSDELANGVAVSFDPFYGTGGYYVNTQLGEDLVTNPEAHSVPEEILLVPSGTYRVLATSNQVPRDQLLMSDAQMDQVRGHLKVIHDEFAELYGIEAGEPFAMEIEFKITSDNVLAIKQARPWVFSDAEAAPSNPNTPATGAPAIYSKPQVGRPLRADTSGIADEDGLVNALFHYQWITNDGTADTDIAGAAGVFYTPTAADVGKAVKVTVSFTDDEGNPETLTSDPTGAVTAKANSRATGEPAISGTAQVGEALTADTSGIADEDGLINAVFSYQWARSDGGVDSNIKDATADAYTLTEDDEGKTLTVQVSFTDDADNEETLTSAATAAVAATLPTKPLNLTVTRGSQIEELDASWQTPASDGGSDITGYRVQWKEAADSWDTPEDVSEETVTGTTHTIHGLTEGVEYAVRVMATNQVGEGPASAEKTAAPRDTRAPEVVTSRVDGATLRVVYDEALDEGSAPPADAFDVRVACRCDGTRWQDEEARGAVDGVLVKDDTVILTLTSPAAADDYVVVSYNPPSDEASPRVQDVVGNAASAIKPTQIINDTEEAKETAEDPPNNPATGAPTISGTAQVGEALTADKSGITDEDGLDNGIFSYQWIAGGTDIDGATGSSYTLTEDEENLTIQVRVSFTDDADNDETLTSVATAAVAPRPPLTVSLVFPVASHHGASNVFAFDIRFSEEFPLSYETLKFHAFSVTGGEVLKAQRMDKPSNIPWRITVRPDSNGDVTVVLPVTTDCDAQGAICTGDGRKLSARLELTVSGPVS